MIARAAETVSWFLFGAEREDYQCPFNKPHMALVWLCWEVAIRRIRVKARDLPRRSFP